MTKQLYILAGANGSEKSTISNVLLPEESLVWQLPDGSIDTTDSNV